MKSYRNFEKKNKIFQKCDRKWFSFMVSIFSSCIVSIMCSKSSNNSNSPFLKSKQNFLPDSMLKGSGGWSCDVCFPVDRANRTTVDRANRTIGTLESQLFSKVIIVFWSADCLFGSSRCMMIFCFLRGRRSSKEFY